MMVNDGKVFFKCPSCERVADRLGKLIDGSVFCPGCKPEFFGQGLGVDTIERKTTRPWLSTNKIPVIPRRELWLKAVMGSSPSLEACEELHLAGLGHVCDGMGGPSWQWNEDELNELSTKEVWRVFSWLRP